MINFRGSRVESSRLIKPDSVRQDLESGIRDCVLAGYTELRADLISPCRCLLSGQGYIGEVPALLREVLDESCSI